MDALDIVPMVRYLVTRHFPDYAPALAGADPLFDDVVLAALQGHLADYDPESRGRWGWKLCETTFILPVLADLFPGLQVVHLVRDGRDVAFCDHVAPTDAFWKKVFFGRSDVEKWHGLALTGPVYRRHSSIFNAQHWQNSVLTARRYGETLGERYIEVRYEDLCQRFNETAERLLSFLRLSPPAGALAALRDTASASSIGKFRRQPVRRRRAVLQLIAPVQIAFDYPATDD